MAVCAGCRCGASDGDAAHAIVTALRDDDLDAALALGLLDGGIACPACAHDCGAALALARTQREAALAALERHRACAACLERRQRERAERRAPPPATTAQKPALPAAAAAALARAKARAAERNGR